MKAQEHRRRIWEAKTRKDVANIDEDIIESIRNGDIKSEQELEALANDASLREFGIKKGERLRAEVVALAVEAIGGLICFYLGATGPLFYLIIGPLLLFTVWAIVDKDLRPTPEIVFSPLIAGPLIVLILFLVFIWLAPHFGW